MATTNPVSSTDNITLRIVILAHGNRAEDDLYLVLNLDTTIAQLKQRIQESLSQHPAPDYQRLIYHGRPLLDGDTPLREILRVEQRAGSPSHAMHLVIRDQAVGNVPATTPAPPSVHAPQPVPAQAIPGLPQPHFHLHGGMPPNMHMAMHNQAHQMQHQIQHAQALNRANQARLQTQQAIHNTQQAQTNHARAAGLPPPNFQQPSIPQGLAPNIQHPTPATPPTHGGMTRIEERIGPNGEHIRTVVDNNGNASSTTMSFRITGLNVPNPHDRPSSAPGASPSGTSDATSQQTNAMPPNIQIHAQQPALPTGLPFLPGMQLPIPLPSMMPPFLHNPMMGASTSSGQTMAWLLSSPQGPQGIVFAPGHGFFTTLSPQAQGQDAQLRPTPTTTATATAPTQTQAQTVVRPQDVVAAVRRPEDPAPPQPGARPVAPGAAVNAPQPAAAPVRQARREGIANQDLLQFMIERGWLFMRLYMFVFILSESGTWRRIIMLGSAIIFCLLPRNNPLRDAFQVARRHFDNLIGPPDIPQRQSQNNAQAQQANVDAAPDPQRQATAASSSRRQAAPMPTPEEAARRLLEQQNRRNPNTLINMLWRVEQGVALFLVSLIPGLGERHIQAREQARRIVDEEERRVREERERREADQPASAQTATSNDQTKTPGPLPESWGTAGAASNNTEASSSGVDRTASGDDSVRLRGNGGPT